MVGAYVASTSEKMEWNAQGKGITYRAFYFTGHRYVEKFMTRFRIDGLTIKRGKLMRTSLLHHIQAKERRRSSMGVQFIFFMVEAQSNSSLSPVRALGLVCLKLVT